VRQKNLHESLGSMLLEYLYNERDPLLINQLRIFFSLFVFFAEILRQFSSTLKGVCFLNKVKFQTTIMKTFVKTVKRLRRYEKLEIEYVM